MEDCRKRKLEDPGDHPLEVALGKKEAWCAAVIGGTKNRTPLSD